MHEFAYIIASSILVSFMQWGKVNTVKFGILELQMDPSNNFGSYRSCLKAAMWRAHGATETREKVSISPILILHLIWLTDWLAFSWFLIWDMSWENLFSPYANNKGTDQPAHPRSLISAFVIRCLDSIIPLVSMPKISSLYLASVAAQTGLRLNWSQTLKTGFLMTRFI